MKKAESLRSGKVQKPVTSPVVKNKTVNSPVTSGRNDYEEIAAQEGESMQGSTQDLLKLPLHSITDAQKRMIIVEERYSWFQIENKLRQLCGDAVEQIRTKQNREADFARKIQV